MKKLNWIGCGTVGLATFLAGVACAEIVGSGGLNSEVAILLGAALGAGITVLGTLWVARFQGTQRERSFARFVADSAAAIRDEAYILTCLIEKEDYGEPKNYANQIKQQISNLKETFELFEGNSPFSDVGNYEARLWIFRLENKIKENFRIFKKEENWLDHPTKAVIDNSRSDLGLAAQAIFEACVHVNRELKFKKPLPDDAEVERRIELLVS